MTILRGLDFSDVIKLDHSRRDASCSLAHWACLLVSEVFWDRLYIARRSKVMLITSAEQMGVCFLSVSIKFG